MKNLFGTDGIRGIPGQYPLDPSGLVALGKAIIHHLGPGQFLLCQDTRESSPELAGYLAQGLRSLKAEVTYGGVLPTPAASWLVRNHTTLSGAVVISASHNPWQDNGVKVFSQDGQKLAPEAEEHISSHFYRFYKKDRFEEPIELKEDPTWCNHYKAYLDSLLDQGIGLPGPFVMDGAHGATSSILQALKERYPKHFIPVAVEPDGKNINQGVGSQHPQFCQNQLKAYGVTWGFTFDGDGDRFLLVHKERGVLDGDVLLYGLALLHKERGELSPQGVVATVMSNMSLKEMLDREDIPLHTCPVGDRHVWLTMEEVKANLGGEASGHIIQRSIGVTGDGLANACYLLAHARLDIVEKMLAMPKYPQLMRNLMVREKIPLENLPDYEKVLKEVQLSLSNQGRFVIRYSGTEPKLRIMVEAKNQKDAEAVAGYLTGYFQRYLS